MGEGGPGDNANPKKGMVTKQFIRKGQQVKGALVVEKKSSKRTIIRDS